MKRSSAAIWLTVILVPLTLFLGSRLPGRWYYLTSTLMILELLVPFFLAFERRRPQARELVLIAVMCALTVASRVVMPIPHFKPVFAIIMLSGIAFGAESGFLVGAVTAFASNFFASQGPWTPWQMMAYGAGGLLAGLVFRKRRGAGQSWVLALFGFAATVLVVGVILDCCTVFTALTTLKWSSVLLVLGQGLPMNISNGICTAVTMLLFGRPLLDILERVQVKYGLLDRT